MTTLEATAPVPVSAPPEPAPADVPRPSAPAPAPRARIRILDGLRLLAALLVLSWHYAAFGHGTDNTPYAQVPFLYPVAAYGWLGVELFFLISGFVIGMSSMGHTVGEFVTSRITRLYPAYWFGVLLTTAVLLAWPVERSSLPLTDVAVNLTMLQTGFGIGSVDAVYWTLWAELHFYVLFTVVVWRGVTYRRTAVFCGAWLAVAYLCGQGGLFGGPGGFITGPLGLELSNLVLADWAPFFVAGVAFFLMYRFGGKPLLWLYVAVAYLLGIRPVLRTLDGSNTHLHTPIPYWPAVVAIAVFFTVMAAVAHGWLRARGRWLSVAGAMTYPLYLIHEFIGWAIMKALHDRVPGPLLYAGTLALMLAAAWLIHRYVERPLAPKVKAGVRAVLRALTRARDALTSAMRHRTGGFPGAPATAGTRSSSSCSPPTR